jgi:DNA topoisomerase IB
VKRCQDIPGYELFQYVDTDGQRHRIDSVDINAYLRQIHGQDFTAKDVRTWGEPYLLPVTYGSSAPANPKPRPNAMSPKRSKALPNTWETPRRSAAKAMCILM